MLQGSVTLGGVQFSVIELMKAGAALEGKIRSLGVDAIDLHDDVTSYQATIDTSRKGYVGEYFHQSINTLPPSMYQGVTCRNKKGEVVATTAIRCDDISGWDLHRYIHEFWSRAYVAEGEERAKLSPDAMSFAKGITGPIAYLGDTFVDKSMNGSNLAAYVVRLCLLIANTKWKPAYTYGWMARNHAFEKALFLRWGYPTCYSGGMVWETPPANKAYEDLCFLGCDQAGIVQLIQRPLDIGLDPV